MTTSHITPVHGTLNCDKAVLGVLGTCNTCIRLQSRVTSSSATVNSWMIFFVFTYLIFLFLFIYLFIFSFLSFACFCFVVDFVFIFHWHIFCCVLLSSSFFPLFVYFMCSFHFIVGGVRFKEFHWSENKISYFGVVYKFLSMGMELAVIKELFIILYI